MSKDYYYDPITKDISLTQLKDLRFTNDIVEYTTQKIEKKLSVFLGEWYLNTEIGIPYIAEKNNDRDDNTKNFFVKDPLITFINNTYRVNLQEISTIDRVVKLESSLDTETRRFTVDFEVVLINGETLQSSIGIGVL